MNSDSKVRILVILLSVIAMYCFSCKYRTECFLNLKTLSNSEITASIVFASKGTNHYLHSQEDSLVRIITTDPEPKSTFIITPTESGKYRIKVNNKFLMLGSGDYKNKPVVNKQQDDTEPAEITLEPTEDKGFLLNFGENKYLAMNESGDSHVASFVDVAEKATKVWIYKKN